MYISKLLSKYFISLLYSTNKRRSHNELKSTTQLDNCSILYFVLNIFWIYVFMLKE